MLIYVNLCGSEGRWGEVERSEPSIVGAVAHNQNQQSSGGRALADGVDRRRDQRSRSRLALRLAGDGVMGDEVMEAPQRVTEHCRNGQWEDYIR